MLHYSAEGLVNKSFTELFVSPTEREHFLERFHKQPESEDFEARFTTLEGDGCWVNLSWSSIAGETVSCTAVNINTRKFAEKINNDTMTKYRQLTENSPTGILIVQDHNIRYTNPAFLKFSGYSAADLLGKEPLIFIEPGEREEFSGFEKRWSATRPAGDKKEFHVMTKSGEIKVGVMFTTPIVHVGKPATLINIVDISAQERLEEQIHSENERRRGIIMTVAHELRTPLQPILGYLNLLIQDPQGFGIVDDTKKIIEKCLVSVERERQIINQMLELSILDSGKLQLSYSTFPLLTLVQSVLDTSGYLSKADVTINISPDLMISADRDRLYSVLDSLLSNSVNYSKPPRKIVISYCSGDNDRTCCISVQDNGSGIPESAFETIFEPFQLADATKLSRKYDRIGLSLSIAKKIIRMHNGDITVKSTVNEGSTFTIHLPRDVSHA
jgi:PAS domain S-box-containing protein